MFRKITMTEISSIDLLPDDFHRFVASLDKCSHELEGSFFLQYGMTMSITSLLVMNSQIPSDACTINLSWCSSSISRISGSQTTPAFLATWSPRDLLIASPGTFWSFSHTRYGPSCFLDSVSNNASTLPPWLNILVRSLSYSGLWSLDKTIHFQVAVSVCSLSSQYFLV